MKRSQKDARPKDNMKTLLVRTEKNNLSLKTILGNLKKVNSK